MFNYDNEEGTQGRTAVSAMGEEDHGGPQAQERRRRGRRNSDGGGMYPPAGALPVVEEEERGKSPSVGEVGGGTGGASGQSWRRRSARDTDIYTYGRNGEEEGEQSQERLDVHITESLPRVHQEGNLASEECPNEGDGDRGQGQPYRRLDRYGKGRGFGQARTRWSSGDDRGGGLSSRATESNRAQAQRNWSPSYFVPSYPVFMVAVDPGYRGPRSPQYVPGLQPVYPSGFPLQLMSGGGAPVIQPCNIPPSGIGYSLWQSYGYQGEQLRHGADARIGTNVHERWPQVIPVPAGRDHSRQISAFDPSSMQTAHFGPRFPLPPGDFQGIRPTASSESQTFSKRPGTAFGSPTRSLAKSEAVYEKSHGQQYQRRPHQSSFISRKSIARDTALKLVEELQSTSSQNMKEINLLKVSELLQGLTGRDFGEVIKELGHLGEANLADAIFSRLRYTESESKLHHLMDEFAYTAMVSVLGLQSNAKKALQLFREMQGRGLKCNVHSYTALMGAAVRSKHYYLAIEIFEEMVSAGHMPTTVTYNTLMDAYGKMGNYRSAIKLLQRMKIENCDPGTRTFNTLMIACNSSDAWKEALMLRQQMEDAGIAPNTTTYNALITAYSKSGDLDKALEVFEEMDKFGFERSVITYSTVVAACERVGRWELALHYFDEMLDRGCTPNVVAFNSFITACAQGGKYQRAQQALRQMEQLGCKPDVVTYTALIQALHRGGKWGDSLRVFQKMREKGCEPDGVSFATIIECLFDSGILWSKAVALELYREASARQLTRCIIEKHERKSMVLKLSLSFYGYALCALHDWLLELVNQAKEIRGSKDVQVISVEIVPDHITDTVHVSLQQIETPVSSCSEVILGGTTFSNNLNFADLLSIVALQPRTRDNIPHTNAARIVDSIRDMLEALHSPFKEQRVDKDLGEDSARTSYEFASWESKGEQVATWLLCAGGIECVSRICDPVGVISDISSVHNQMPSLNTGADTNSKHGYRFVIDKYLRYDDEMDKYFDTAFASLGGTKFKWEDNKKTKETICDESKGQNANVDVVWANNVQNFLTLFIDRLTVALEATKKKEFESLLSDFRTATFMNTLLEKELNFRRFEPSLTAAAILILSFRSKGLVPTWPGVLRVRTGFVYAPGSTLYSLAQSMGKDLNC